MGGRGWKGAVTAIESPSRSEASWRHGDAEVESAPDHGAAEASSPNRIPQ